MLYSAIQNFKIPENSWSMHEIVHNSNNIKVRLNISHCVLNQSCSLSDITHRARQNLPVVTLSMGKIFSCKIPGDNYLNKQITKDLL